MSPPAMAIDGDVVAVHSFWTEDRSRIITKATVRTPEGQEVVVSQLGGTVDGIGMITIPGPPLLEVGMTVAVTAHRDVDLSLREHVVLDGARVLGYPPGYVRTGPNTAGKYLYWESGCVFVTLDAPGTSQLPGELEFDVIQAAIDEWNDRTATCSQMNLVNDGRRALEVGNDQVNLIKFREVTWGRPAIGDAPAHMYSPLAAALTTVTFNNRRDLDNDGAIVDADIEFNGVDFAIAADGQTAGRARCRSDLQNTLTHELGHLLGLEHTCLASGDPPRFDHLGRPVPSCALANDIPEIVDATMYNFQDCGEISKATLSDDDVLALCEIYPRSDDPGVCERVSTDAGCCSASDRPGAGLLLAGLTMLVVLRRRARPAIAPA